MHHFRGRVACSGQGARRDFGAGWRCGYAQPALTRSLQQKEKMPSSWQKPAAKVPLPLAIMCWLGCPLAHPLIAHSPTPLRTVRRLGPLGLAHSKQLPCLLPKQHCPSCHDQGEPQLLCHGCRCLLDSKMWQAAACLAPVLSGQGGACRSGGRRCWSGSAALALAASSPAVCWSLICDHCWVQAEFKVHSAAGFRGARAKFSEPVTPRAGVSGLLCF